MIQKKMKIYLKGFEYDDKTLKFHFVDTRVIH